MIGEAAGTPADDRFSRNYVDSVQYSRRKMGVGAPCDPKGSDVIRLKRPYNLGPFLASARGVRFLFTFPANCDNRRETAERQIKHGRTSSIAEMLW